MNRLDNMSDNEIKEVERSGPQKIIQALEYYIKVCQPKTNVYEISEMYELRVAQKYLMSPYFDKKIRGMADFKEIFQKIDKSNRHSQNILQQNGIPHTRFLNFQNLS